MRTRLGAVTAALRRMSAPACANQDWVHGPASLVEGDDSERSGRLSLVGTLNPPVGFSPGHASVRAERFRMVVGLAGVPDDQTQRALAMRLAAFCGSTRSGP